MRYLGLDLGTKTLGIAISESGIIANSFTTLKHDNDFDYLISELKNIIEEKKINYNIKELQRSLESYNSNAQRLSEFINKDVADALKKNSGEIDNIKKANQKIEDRLEEERRDISQILAEIRTSNELIRKSIEESNVNEAYIYDILDRWAEDRHIKIKK